MRHATRRLALLAGICAAALAVGACDDQQDAVDRSTSNDEAPADRTKPDQQAQNDPDRPQSGRAPAAGDGTALATARLKGSDGEDKGTIEIMEIAGKVVIVRFEATGIAPGARAIHFHEKGVCDGPDFKTAGEHWRPRNWTTEGPDKDIDPGHLGTIVADQQGRVETALTNAYVTLKRDAPNTLFDDNGTSIVIHTNPDKNAAKPGGDTGGRIACAVVKPKA